MEDRYRTIGHVNAPEQFIDEKKLLVCGIGAFFDGSSLRAQRLGIHMSVKSAFRYSSKMASGPIARPRFSEHIDDIISVARDREV